MWGLVILGLVILIPSIIATITWDSDFPIELRVAMLIVFIFWSCLFIPPTVYRLYLKIKVWRNLMTNEEAFNKCKKRFGEGLTGLVYFYCMDEWFYKTYKDDIDEFIRRL